MGFIANLFTPMVVARADLPATPEQLAALDIAEEQQYASRTTPERLAAGARAVDKVQRGAQLSPTDISDLMWNAEHRKKIHKERAYARGSRTPLETLATVAPGVAKAVERILLWPTRRRGPGFNRLSARPDPNDLAARFRSGGDLDTKVQEFNERIRWPKGGDDGLPPSRFSGR